MVTPNASHSTSIADGLTHCTNSAKAGFANELRELYNLISLGAILSHFHPKLNQTIEDILSLSKGGCRYRSQERQETSVSCKVKEILTHCS